MVFATSNKLVALSRSNTASEPDQTEMKWKSGTWAIRSGTLLRLINVSCCRFCYAAPAAATTRDVTHSALQRNRQTHTHCLWPVIALKRSINFRVKWHSTQKHFNESIALCCRWYTVFDCIEHHLRIQRFLVLQLLLRPIRIQFLFSFISTSEMDRFKHVLCSLVLYVSVCGVSVALAQWLRDNKAYEQCTRTRNIRFFFCLEQIVFGGGIASYVCCLDVCVQSVARAQLNGIITQRQSPVLHFFFFSLCHLRYKCVWCITASVLSLNRIGWQCSCRTLTAKKKQNKWNIRAVNHFFCSSSSSSR